MSVDQIWKKVEKANEVYQALKKKIGSIPGIYTSDLPVLTSIAVLMEIERITTGNVDVDSLVEKIASYLQKKLYQENGSTVSEPQLQPGLIDYERLAREITKNIKVPSGSSLTPYIKLGASWTYPEPESDKEDIDAINMVLGKIPEDWEPLGHYMIEGEKEDIKEILS